MEAINSWWGAMSRTETVLWLLAVPASLLTILQVLLATSGRKLFGGQDTEFQLFGPKGITVFIAAFCWMTIVSLRAGFPVFIATVIGGVLGVLFLVLFAWLYDTIHRHHH
jgi:hypothetical protein